MRAALTADSAYAEGDYESPPRRGLRAIGRAWAGWALSQAFYREHMYRELGYSSLEDFLVRYWEGMYLGRDANNLLSMITTWQRADVSANDRHRGDYPAAMAAIAADVLVMPGRTDLYFPPEDSELEVSLLTRGELRVIPSLWGHYAGGGRAEADVRFIDAALKELLARAPGAGGGAAWARRPRSGLSASRRAAGPAGGPPVRAGRRWGACGAASRPRGRAPRRAPTRPRA